MYRIAGICILFLLFSLCSKAQTSRTITADSTKNKKDTPYVNVGKIAARRAVIQSAILPGLGQINNKVTVWSIGKVAAIYGGFVALTISYQDNNKNYHIFLDELTYRAEHNGQPDPQSPYAQYPTQGLYTAKDVYRRNKEIIIFSYVGIYLINLVDAYVSTRLKYWNVTETISFQLKPGLISTSSGYASNTITTPALKLSLRL